MEEVGSRMHKYSAPFTQKEWLARLQTDETFAMDFIGILQSSPFKAYSIQVIETNIPTSCLFYAHSITSQEQIRLLLLSSLEGGGGGGCNTAHKRERRFFHFCLVRKNDLMRK
jgi:hypothetical protein